MDTTDRRHLEDRRIADRGAPDRRRGGRPRHVALTLADFHAINGQRNLTLRELADLSNVSADKLLTLIPDHLDAFIPPGFNQYFVTYREAWRFLRDLRLV